MRKINGVVLESRKPVGLAILCSDSDFIEIVAKRLKNQHYVIFSAVKLTRIHDDILLVRSNRVGDINESISVISI